MARKRYTVEEIIGQLRTIEIELGKVTSPQLLGHRSSSFTPAHYRAGSVENSMGRN